MSSEPAEAASSDYHETTPRQGARDFRHQARLQIQAHMSRTQPQHCQV